ncbi:integral memnbrane protein [Campylobacter coli]|uniref:integral memnbrane protein n=1 Tax=Campylobacter coli TaxID=195 RepID=UPI0012824213|nr:integral memnbrane protein [Campylobacter coli]EAH5016843.1 integral memnbrane protein [Campylobacter coli]EAI9195488.1 integral memnbrane protein [Campylobacter coli]EAK4966486.1 integral memnbrane protein [Campylobacter coli]EAM0306345.1 integral memnbrane protein [Campylobacter coli]EAW7517087.1 integral memnbrane protein [Campylobacter coli]
MNYKLSLSPLFLLELVASILFIVFFGLGNFLIFILASMIFGVILLGIFWKNMLEFRISGFKDMLTQFAFVMAAFLFIFPGIITSIFGFFVLCFGLIFNFAKPRYKRNYRQNNTSDEEIIDVEIIEDRK